MCFGGSPPTEEHELEQPNRAVTGSGRPPTSTRPRTSQRPSSTHPISQRPPTSNRRPPSQGQSRQGRQSRAEPPHSRKGSSHPHGRGKSRGGRLPAVTEDETTTPEVMNEISILCASIEQHAAEFYNRNSQTSVRRTVSQTVIEELITGRNDGSSVAQRLINSLSRYANQPDTPRRTDDLIEICRTANRVQRRVARHAAEWDFGPWTNGGMLFPTVAAGGKLMREAQYD